MSIVTRWKAVSFVLVVVCVALAYRVLDQGITRTYLDASIESLDRHIKLLTSLIEEDLARYDAGASYAAFGSRRSEATAGLNCAEA